MIATDHRSRQQCQGWQEKQHIQHIEQPDTGLEQVPVNMTVNERVNHQRSQRPCMKLGGRGGIGFLELLTESDGHHTLISVHCE